MMQKKYKTKTSQKILEFLQENKEHVFSAADVYEYLPTQGMQVNLATVYRNLERLTEEGTLMRSKSANSESFLYQFSENKECHAHLHLQCRQCGKVYHLKGDFMAEIAVHLREQYGFDLECDKSSLSGICQLCRTQNGE